MLRKLVAVTIAAGLMSPALLVAQESPKQERSEERHEGTERHPHIRAAIHELQEARTELERADHDFGGHRKEAIEAIDNALRQLRQALQYDKK